MIPQDLRKQRIDLAHEGHQGKVKTKGVGARDGKGHWRIHKILSCMSNCTKWSMQLSWPSKINNITCQTLATCGNRSLWPWQNTLGAHWLLFAMAWGGNSPLYSNIYYHSHIEWDIFSTWLSRNQHLSGDDRTQFTFKEFQQYLLEINVKHRKLIPYWPQANREVERFNRCCWKWAENPKQKVKIGRKRFQKFCFNTGQQIIKLLGLALQNFY